MSFLEQIFKVFKQSALYHSYSEQQQMAVDQLLELYQKDSKTDNLHNYNDEFLIRNLEKKVTRKVISASIPLSKLIKALQDDYISPKDLELVNIFDDVDEEHLLEPFLNLFVSKINVHLFDEMLQLKMFPDEGLKYLTLENKRKIKIFKQHLIKSNNNESN